jgi:hypothetical protein
MSETYLEADEGVSYTRAMTEEQDSHKVVLVNTEWIEYVYNKDGFHIYHRDVTDEQTLSRTFKGLQLEAGEGAMTPTYLDNQCETEMSMTLSDAYSWRSHSPGVLVEGIGRWVDDVQVPENLVFSPLSLTPVWQIPANARLALVADQGGQTTPYPELTEEDFVFEP